MQTFLWGVTVVGSVLGALCLFSALILANGAPQQAALAAIGAALAVIPYCVARAHSMLGRVECQRCDERISVRAVVCPHCGGERKLIEPKSGAF